MQNSRAQQNKFAEEQQPGQTQNGANAHLQKRKSEPSAKHNQTFSRTKSKRKAVGVQKKKYNI